MTDDLCQPCIEAVTILDGGMGHQLKSMGIEISGPVGSIRRFLGVATANVEKPQMVIDAHLAFIDAGAQCVITNNYACVPKCLEHTAATALGEEIKKHGIGGMVSEAGRLARAACALRPDRKVTVAGSLPPLAESYRADLVGPFLENLNHYKEIARCLAPHVDVLVCETMSTVDEARAAATAAATTGLPVWVSWTLDESRPILRSGETIQDAVDAIKSVEGLNLTACLFNCTSPEVITEAMPMLRGMIGREVQIGAYANGFCTAAEGSGEYRDLSPHQYYEDFATKWIASGATIVGGCCGVFPPHIAHLHERLGSIAHSSLTPTVGLPHRAAL
jgi:S-methylmethionine-dependent homocysteine/selenocysteine methylase